MSHRTLGQIGRGLATTLLALFVVVQGVIPALAASIETDVFVYQNGDTVTVTGDGFGPTETVDVVTTDPNADVNDQGTSLTDDAGNFTYRFVLNATVPGLYDVTATGETSGLTAMTQFDPPPNAPVNMRYSDARPNGTGVTLTWDRVTSQSVDCYWVFRSTSSMIINGVTGDFTCPPATAPANFLASINQPAAGTTVSYPDTTAASGTDYFYAVAAVKSGNNQGQSVGSNQVATASLKASSLASASHDFGAINVGSSSSAFNVSYTNSGQSTITVRAITSVGTNAADFAISNISPAVGASVAVNGTLTFDVTFSPSATGSRSASIEISASDPAHSVGVNNTHVMPVSGNGTPSTTATTLTVAIASGTYGGSVNLSATLETTPGGVAVSGRSVSFTLNGNSAGSATTDAAGLASKSNVSLGSIGAGTYGSGVSASFAGDASFAASTGTASLTVNKAALSVTADNKSRGYGDANPSFTVTYAGFVNGDTASSLGGTLSCSSTATASSPVGAYPITCSGQTSSNYTITYVAGTLTVAKAVLTVTANDQSRHYGDANPAFTYAFTGFRNGDTSSVVSGTATCTSSAVATTPVGTVAITCAQGSLAATNYSFAFVNGALTIMKAPLTVTAADASRGYGDANPSFTGTITGIKNGDNITASYATTATPSSNAGTFAITPSLNDPGSKLGNYTVTSNNGTLTITKVTLTVTADDKSRAYGDANPAFTAGYSGFKLSDGPVDLGGSLSCVSSATPSSDVGTYPISCSGQTSPNYTINYVNGQLTVGKAALTVTANDQSRAYGDANPTFTYTIAGFQNGDTVAVVTGNAGCSTSADQTTGIGSFAITCAQGTLSATNYSFSFTSGSLAITKAPLTVTAANKSKEYGEANPALTGTVVGVKNSDPITATYTTAATPSSPAGSYSIVGGVSGGPAVLANYVVTTNDATLTVTKAPLTVNADDSSKTYGHANPAFSVSYAGFKLSDGPGDLGGTLSFATAATASSVVGGYPVSPSGLTSSNYAISFADGTLTITKAPLSVTVADKTKIYGDANPTLTGTVTGLVNDDAITASYSTSATVGSPVGTYAITSALSDPDSKLANYDVTSTNGTLTVTKAPLSVTADNKSRVYGHANPAFTGLITGIKNGDAITASYSTNATPASSVGTYAIVPSPAGTGLGNYDVTSSNGTLTVTPASLTVTADAASRTYGDANPSFTGSVIGVQNLDDITATYDTAATPGSAIGDYLIVPTLHDPDGTLSNYSVTVTNGTLTITKAPLTVTADDKSRGYGEPNPAFTRTVSGVKNSDGITTTFGSAATQSSNAGAFAITSTLDDPSNKLGNYEVTTNDGTLTITKAPLTVKADDKSKAYGAANPAFTVSYEGFKLSDGPGDLGGTLSFATAADASSPVGTYPVTPSGLTSGNYSITFANGELTIGKAALTVTASDQSRAYGDANPTFTYVVSGFQNGDTGSVVSGDADCTTPATQATGVGTYAITCSQGTLDADNYSFSFTSGTLTITKAPLTVTAAAKSKVYGDANPALTGTLVGVKNVDPVSDGYSTTATVSSHVGSYPITADVSAPAGVLANYSITRNDASLSVTKAPLSVTADDSSKIYGHTNPGFSVSYDGFKLSDGPGDLGGTLSFATAATASSDVGLYPVTPDGLTSGDYAITSTDGTLTITKAPLTVTAADKSKIYGDANPTLTGTLSGVVNGDDITASYSTSATAASPIGTYAINPSLNDPDSRLSNYSVTSTNGTLTVTKAPLTVTADHKSRVYGDANPAFTGVITGIKNGDAITASYSTSATPASSVGGYAIVPFPAGAELGNYDVTVVNGTLTVTKAPLTVTAADKTKVYGDPNPAFTGSVTGIKNGDAITASYASAADETTGVGDHAILPSLSDPTDKLGNYDVTSGNGTLTVTKAPLTLTAADKTKIYGDANPALTGVLTGVKNSDNITASYSTSATAGSPVGPYAITVSLNDPAGKLSNYTVTSTNGTLTVTKAPLTVTADNKSKILGAANPTLTGSITGIKNGDNITASYSTTATPASPVGTYPITSSLNDPTGKLGNYTVTITSGRTLTIQYATGTCLGEAGRTVLQPVNADHTSVWKKGSTVPVKFRVCDVNGNSIGGSQTVVALAEDGSGHRAPWIWYMTGNVGPLDETVVSTTPDVDFRWSSSDQQWIFNLNTKNLQAGIHYWYQINLVDGSNIQLDFATK